MNGRMYDYRLGRFLSVDPIISNPANSQSINPYSYIGNNPLSGMDPTGYCAEGTEAKTGSHICQVTTEGAASRIATGVNKGSITKDTTLAQVGKQIGAGLDTVKSALGGMADGLKAAFGMGNGADGASGKQSNTGDASRVNDPATTATRSWAQGAQRNVSASPLLSAEWTATQSTFVGAAGIAASGLELAAAGSGAADAARVAAVAKGVGAGFAVAGFALDAWALKVDPRMTAARFSVNTGVGFTSFMLGGPPGLLLGAGYYAMDKVGPEAPGYMVTMDGRGRLSSTPWNYGGGWGGMAYTAHPANYNTALVLNGWFMQTGLSLPSNAGF